LPEKVLILGRIQRDIFINVRRSSHKVPVFSCSILMKLEFPRRISEKYSVTKFNENPSSGSPSSSMRSYGQTDLKLIVAFRSFANDIASEDSR